jgi:hypothetical protein
MKQTKKIESKQNRKQNCNITKHNIDIGVKQQMRINANYYNIIPFLC